MKIPTINQQNSFITNSNSINFKKRPRTAITLSDQISRVLPELTKGDIITVGRNSRETLAALFKTLGCFTGIIKRIFHINAGVSVPMAFTVSDSGEFLCTNIGEKTFALIKNIKNSFSQQKHLALDPNDSDVLEDGDTIINGKNEILLTDWLSEYANTIDGVMDIPDYSDMVSNVYDFSVIRQEKSEEINKMILQKLLEQQDKKTPASKLSFANVGGLDNVIDELKRSVVYPIKYPFAYKNIALNKGILLYGPPGTGKTLLAESLAGECNAHYKKICGSDLESKWVGESEKQWRDLFQEAKENQPSIIFIDEFDSVAKSRDGANSSEHGSKVVNQILALMSDLEKNDDQVFVLAATNKPQLFDNAMMRSGRFGKHIEVTAPDRNGLGAIFNIHARNKVLDKNLDKEALLDEFYKRKMNGADIKHVVNEAHLNSWIRNNVYEKMEAGTFSPQDMTNIAIIRSDFDKVLEQLDKQQNKNDRRKIGF